LPGIVRLSGKLICASDDEASIVRTHLPEHVRLTQAEAGCLFFEVRQTNDARIWTVEESFANREAFEAHKTRAQASAWGAATANIRREYVIMER
jgi:quinol monooxygenase YgiN